VQLPDKLGPIYPPVLVGSEVQLLVGLDLLPRAEANKGAFLERFPDRMAIHYVDCFECVHLIWFGSFTLGALEVFRLGAEIDPLTGASCASVGLDLGRGEQTAGFLFGLIYCRLDQD
jgi:hypothetical protein